MSFFDSVVRERTALRWIATQFLKFGAVRLNITAPSMMRRSLKPPYLPGSGPAGDKPHRDCYVAYRDFFLGSDGTAHPRMSMPVHFFPFEVNKPLMEMWNDAHYQSYRKSANLESAMDKACAGCYQSSHCNWNRKTSFLQIGEKFSPDWSGEL